MHRWEKNHTQTCKLTDFTLEKKCEEKDTDPQLQKGFIALLDWERRKLQIGARAANPEMHVSIKGKQQAVIARDSFPRQGDAPICLFCLLPETCCFPEAQIPGDMERLMRFVQPLDYFLLCSCTWTPVVLWGECQPHQELFHSFGCETEGHKNPHCFSSVPIVKEKGWLRANGYCRSVIGCTGWVIQRFSFYTTLSLLRIQDCWTGLVLRVKMWKEVAVEEEGK